MLNKTKALFIKKLLENDFRDEDFFLCPVKIL